MLQKSSLQVPDNLEQCQQLIVQMYEQMQNMQYRLDHVLRLKYGPKAETVIPGQMRLFDAPVAETPQAEQIDTDSDRKSSEGEGSKGHGRKKPAKSLPRRRVVYELPESERNCRCCAQELAIIGEEVSEQYDYTPASVEVVEHVRLKYACKNCQENVEIAAKPSVPVERGLAAAGMLAYVATSKFADHLPLNRLEGIFKRDGAVLSRSTMCDWLAATAGILSPLYEAMKGEVLNSKVVWTDDTPVKMQDRSHEKNIREARLWVYIGDSRHQFTIFDFTESRKRDGPLKFLANYKGYLQADAFAGYDCIYAGGNVVEVACHAHARRKFFEALSTNKFLCTVALNIIRYLYQLERQASEMSPEQRLELRLKFAEPALRAYRKWLDWQYIRTLPKSPFGKAIAYSLNNWAALCRYVQDGDLTIDNNKSERAVRPVAIGRKNWLFAGSKEGGKTAAIISSFIQSCKQHGLNPYSYLKDVLIQLTSRTKVELRDLLPDRWKPAM